MISILVVLPEGNPLDELAGRNPSVEVLTAHRMDDTLEKLGRNRRIDAVLFLGGREVPEIVAAVMDDNPAHPPLFIPAGHSAVPGTRPLAATAPLALLDLLVRTLET